MNDYIVNKSKYNVIIIVKDGRRVFNRVVLAVLLVMLVSNGLFSCRSFASFVRIVDNNVDNNTIIALSQTSSDQEESAAKILQHYIERSSKVRLPIMQFSGIPPQHNKQITIWIGVSAYVDKLELGLDQLDGDGFVISYPDERNIVIIGPTDWGTEFGVYNFLERYVGVRWLLPGPDGEDVPENSILDIPIKEVRDEPVFFSRQLSGFRGKSQYIWARRNRMHGRIKFHHNLLNLFPPEQYTKTRPEFFPIRKGKRYLPANNKDYKWQPCFTQEGIVEEAIKNIVEYFDVHPEATSYSLGVNDSSAFCECGECSAKYSRHKNSQGYRDFSNPYYEWANAVVEGVLKKHPDKWFGCLAYREVAEPPAEIPVHPRIIPYLTYDRMKWIDPGIQAEGQRMTAQWRTKVPILGWYDYIYGTPYLLPRIYWHKMQDYYRYADANGVRAMYAEAYPNWGEGPKLYVSLRLQWNPSLDVDALLREWYVRAVGKGAASDLAAFYDLWEEFWTTSVARSKWFTKHGLYLRFKEPGYLDIVNYDHISKSRKLLESVVTKAHSKNQKARAELLLRAFEYYEASVISYLGLVKKVRKPGKNERYYQDMNRKRYRLVDEYQNDAVLIHPLRFDSKRYEKLTW